MIFLLWAHLIMALCTEGITLGAKYNTHTHHTDTTPHRAHGCTGAVSREKTKTDRRIGCSQMLADTRFPPALLSIPELGLFELPKDGNKL